MNKAKPSCRRVTTVHRRSNPVVTLFRGGVLTFASLLLLMPASGPVTTSQAVINDPIPVKDTFAEASNFVRVNLPYPVNSITVGTTSQGPGFAYVHGDLLRFKNPVSLVDDSVFIGTDSVIHPTLTSADMDSDSHSEFLIMKFSVFGVYCQVVDFDDDSKTNYSCLVPNPIEILTGDFDGNGKTDFAVYNQDSLVIMNTTDGSIMKSFNFPGDVVRACAGNFSLFPGDEIAVLFNRNPNAWVQTVGGRVGYIRNSSTSNAAGCDIVRFRRETEFDDIALTFVGIGGTGDQSSLRTYYGDLTPMFMVGNPYSRGPPFVKTGHFNGDLQEDLAVLSMTRALVWFVNGYDGSTIRTSVEECNGAHWRTFATAVLDSDSFTDVAVEGPRGQLTLVRGVNGRTGYEEPRAPGPFTQVLTYDINNDTRNDIVALTDKITILLSDILPPVVSLEPLYPAHPTFYDSYIKIELTAVDELMVSNATIHIRPAGAVMSMTYQSHPMIRTPNGKFLFIMTGLQPSDFNYYIEVIDPYLNVYSYGNETSPKILTVEGHFAWGRFFNTTIEQAQTNALALGNDSTGEGRILAMTIEPSLGTATLRIYSPNGSEIAQIEIVSTSVRSTFEVYSGMLDGDNILDPVVAEYNKTYTRFRILHGSNLTLWKDSTYFIPSVLVNHGSMMFDDDQDMADEIHYMGVNGTTYYLIRADTGFSSWANITLAGNATIVGAAQATIQPPYPQIGILRGDNKVDVYQAYNLTWLDTLDYSSPDFTLNDLPVTIRAYHNASHPTDSFLAVYGGWFIDTAVTYMCMVDGNTLTVGNPPSYQVWGRHTGMIALYDTDADSTDEILFFDNAGNVSLFDLSYAEIRRWTAFVSEAGPLSSELLDYDGDGADELLISTSDDKLTAVSLSGIVDYQATIGMLFNMVDIGDVDVGSGHDLAAFPILRAASTLGAIRDIELFYVLDVGFALESNMVLQGANLWANTTVLNVFHEPVTDAFVSLTAQYKFGGGTSEQSFGSIYDNSSQQYSSTITPNWPMGMINMSLAVSHEYYDSYSDSFVSILRVESPLAVSLFVESQVMQGGNLPVNASVTDSLGGRVTDADVNVTLAGIVYPAYYNGEFYHVLVTNITLGPGIHTLVATADHPYSVGKANRSGSFSVVTSALVIIRNSPTLVEQDAYFIIELAIADQFGHPITGASVVIDFGITEFSMLETGPGLYLLNDMAAMPVGNYTCEIQVSHPFIVGISYGSFNIGVIGNLSPVVGYQGTVEAGSFFNISVFVYDHYGTVPTGANVTIDVGGTIYRANSTGGADFRATVLANFSIGVNSFTVYVQATFGHPTSKGHLVMVISVPDTMISSSLGWVIGQGQSTLIRLQLRDWSGSPVMEATVITLSPGSLAFTDLGNGTYMVMFSTVGYAPNLYDFTVSVTHSHLHPSQVSENLTIVGFARLYMERADPFLNYLDQTFNFTVTDQYGNPLSGFEYTGSFAGVFNTSGVSATYRFNWTIFPAVTPGMHELKVTVIGPYLSQSNYTWRFVTRSGAVATVVTPVLGSSYVQGNDDIAFAVNVTDRLGNAMAHSSVRILIREITYLLTVYVNGTYTALVATSGWAPGNYSYIVFLTHEFLDYADHISGSVTVVGRITLDITVSTSAPEQNTTLTVTVRVTDWYAHSMTGANVTLEFAGITRVVPETSTPGVYETQVDIGFISHGQHEIVVCAEHLLCIQANSTLVLQVTVRAPEISMSTQTFMFGSGLSFLVSFIGLLIYFRISSSLAVVDISSKATVKSVRRMDMLYGVIVGLGGLTLVHSFLSAQAGQFGLALAESVLLLGISVLLYGIWLYRDANYAIIQAKRISKKRMIMGLWHLIFVPLVIMQIFEWGGRIEWFQYYVLESTFNLGPIAIPTIMLTIFATYVSSIGIVVVNLYREIRNSLARLERMASAGTPPSVVAEERLHLVGRMGSSIRIKFFMFLVILAGTTVMTMDFLRSYSLGVIVLMPVVFLIAIPYVSSKMLRGASRVSGKMRERKPPTSPSLTEVADRVTEVSERAAKESYEPPDKSVPGADTDWKPD